MADRPHSEQGRPLTPDGAYTTFAIPTANAIAVGITLGPDGNAWFAEFGPNPNKIGRVTPDGVITEFSLPAGKSLGSLAGGSDGNVWYTESTSSNGPPAYSLGHISTADASMSDFALPTNGRAQGMVAGADGNLWIGWVESSGTKYDVLRVTPSGTTTSYALPSISATNALGATMLLGPDLNVWFTYQNNLARVKRDGTVTLYAIPTANANMLPAGLAVGMDGNLWFSEFSSGKIGQLIVRTATDSGQATINESATLGGLPQAMFLWRRGRAVFRKRGALDEPHCEGESFIISGQLTTQSSPQLTIIDVATSVCADVWSEVLVDRTSTSVGEGIFNPDTDSIAARFGNEGPDEAADVQMLLTLSNTTLAVKEAAARVGDAPATCSVTSQTVLCTAASIPPFQSIRVIVHLQQPLPPDEQRGAHADVIAFSATPDQNIENNRQSEQIRLSPDKRYDIISALFGVGPIAIGGTRH